MCMIISNLILSARKMADRRSPWLLSRVVDYVSATGHAYGHSVLGVDGSMRAAELWRW
jgi:hypothetical protein